MMPTDLPRHSTAFAEGGVHLVTVPVDYSENTWVLVDELRARAIEKGTRPMIEVVRAFDRAPIAEIASDDRAALDRKLDFASRVFADRGAWLPTHRRIHILRRIAELMEGKREHLGRQIALEGGKPLSDALVETDRAIDGVRNAADELRVRAGREIPMGLTPASDRRRGFHDRRAERGGSRDLRLQPSPPPDRPSGRPGHRGGLSGDHQAR